MSPDRKEPGRGETVGSRLPDCITPLHRAFFTDVFLGNYKPPTRAQIEASVTRQLAYTPLVQLTLVEEANLYMDAIDREEDLFMGKRFELLAGKTYFTPAQSPDPLPHENYFYVGQGAGEVGAQFNLQPLTREEKERYLTDITVSESASFQTQRGSFSVHAYGSRNLTAEQQPGFNTPFFINDHYGYSKGDFTNLLGTIRLAQGKTSDDPLRGLDLGGSYGQGAYDAEALDPNLTMTNITVTPEMVYLPMRGGTQLLPAERLPASFAGKFDLIISYFAFPYMRYPDLALQNAISALSRGGIMSVAFGYGRNQRANEEENELFRRIDRQFQHMERLHEEGKIRYLPLWNPKYNDARDKWKENPQDVYGQVFLQKTA